MNKKTGIVIGIIVVILLIVGIIAAVIITNKFNDMNDEIHDLKKDKKDTKEDKSFQVLDVTIELGNELPYNPEVYVKIEDNQSPNEYDINLDKVDVTEVGEYTFTITYKGKTKNGKVSVVDTTPPEVVVKDVTIKEGDSLNPSQFIVSCNDFSGCNYSFKDAAAVSKYEKAGTYQVYINAVDNYNNTSTKKATLTITTTDSRALNNLKEINIDDLEKKLNNEESFILVISQTTCQACANYKPKMESVLKKHNLTAYYIEKDLLNTEEIKRLSNIANISGTPTTIFIVNGEEETVTNRIVGNQDESVIEKRLASLGYTN